MILMRPSRTVVMLTVLAGSIISCGPGAAAIPPISPQGTGADRAARYGYHVVNSYPHDRNAFTEGLAFAGGRLYESTGSYVRPSDLREVDLRTGAVLRHVELPTGYFGEGLTAMSGRLVQLTWQTNRAFVYDLASFAPQRTFTFDGEGWGLTQDGTSLIQSNGSDEIVFRDPSTFAAVRRIRVTDRGAPVRLLNELEYIRGDIYANVFQSDDIVRIDPRTGSVVGRLDLRGLRPPDSGPEGVLNGIAWDGSSDRLYVTGKLWPSLYEIRLKRQ